MMSFPADYFECQPADMKNTCAKSFEFEIKITKKRLFSLFKIALGIFLMVEKGL